MSALAQQIWAVGRTEWRVTWRGLGLKLVLAMLALPFIPYLLMPRTSWDDNGLHVFTFLAPLFGLLAAFLIVPAPRRERRYRTAELTWTRPLDSLAYMAGKALAAALVMAVLLVELIVLVAITQLTAGFSVGPGLAANALLLVAPTLLCIAALYLLCGALLPHPLLGYVVALAWAFGFMFYLAESSIYLRNPNLIAIFYNKALGFGPDGPLLLANRLFYLGLAVMLAGCAIAIFGRRERRALAPRRQVYGALAMLLCGLALAGGGFWSFQGARAAVMIFGPVVAPRPVALSIHGYSLDLRLDPASGGENGVATFAVRNDGASPVAALPLRLNAGLTLSAATVDGHAAAVNNSPQFGTVALAPALAPGHSTAVRVAYTGRFTLLHAQYGANDRGVQNGNANMYELAPVAFQSYIWNAQAMLYRDGDWFPTPWTQDALRRQPAPLGWRTLILRLPGGAIAIASSNTARREGHDQVFTWRLSGRLPQAILAVPPAGYRRVTVANGAIYAPDGDAATLRARYGPYITALRDLERFFGRPPGTVAVVAIPLGQIDNNQPSPTVALGGSLVLAPMDGIDITSVYGSPTVSRLAAPAPYRAALSDVSIAWWNNHLPELPIAQVMPLIAGGKRSLNPLPPDLPNGYVGLNELDGGSGPLPDYTAAATAEQRLGSAYYAREMALRRAIAAVGRTDTGGNLHLYTIAYMGKGPLAHQLQALGLLGRLDDGGFTPDASPALDDLRHAIGAQRLRNDLIEISTAGATPNDDASAACALYHLTGKPVTAWANRYLPSYAMIKPAGGCR